MIKNKKYHILFLFCSLSIFAQQKEIRTQVLKTDINISYLDSLKSTFVSDNLASCVDSLWMKELTSLDIYNNLESDIKTINLDENVEYELPTTLLKARLKEMDSKSPFKIEYNQGLENLIKSFLKNRKKSYERLMAISEYYFPIFESALAKQNVPLEIKYLAVIESALNPKAVSRVGATGLWQFMYQTGKQYNLDIDSYVDERSDPLKSSEAAAQYMTNMYKIFGDWDLVLASYNSGPGNVAKAIRRSGGQQNYWNIRKNLPKETQGYVPAFLATMYIYEYHKEHGIIPNRAIVKHFETDTVMIKKQLTFKQISNLLEVPVAQLQVLNPQFKLDIVPAYFDKKQYLRLPTNKIALFTSNEDKIYAYVQHELDKKEKPYFREEAIAASETSKGDSYVVSKTKYHKVKRGDNLSEIAQQYGVSMAEVRKWNKLRNNHVQLGRNLKIISTERIVSNTKTDKSEPIEKPDVAVAFSKPVIAAKIYKEEKVVSFKEVAKTYKVKKGDNLGGIAIKYGVSVADIKSWNKRKSNSVSVGEKLKITSVEKVVMVVKKEIKSDTAGALAATNKINSNELTTDKTADFYIVQQGDNLSSIANKYNVTIDQLKQWNKLEDNNIQLESKLKIADIIIASKEEASTKTDFKNKEYTILKGDNLGSIARKNGVAVSDLKDWNDLVDDNVQIGTKIIVERKAIASSQSIVSKDNKKDKNSDVKNSDLYYVKKGDSLFSIAKKYPGVSISDIKKWNGINGSELKPGMKLKING